MPCCPRDCFSRWNLLPYNNLPKIFGTWALTMPGPLSSTTTRKRPSPFVSSAFCFMASRPRSWTSTAQLGQDAGFLAGVERVVDGFLDGGEQRLRGVVEAEQVAVLGEELRDRDLALLRGQRLGRHPRRLRRHARSGRGASSGAGSRAAGGEGGGSTRALRGARRGRGRVCSEQVELRLLALAARPRAGLLLLLLFRHVPPSHDGVARAPRGPRKRGSLASHARRPREVRSPRDARARNEYDGARERRGRGPGASRGGGGVVAAPEPGHGPPRGPSIAGMAPGPHDPGLRARLRGRPGGGRVAALGLPDLRRVLHAAAARRGSADRRCERRPRLAQRFAAQCHRARARRRPARAGEGRDLRHRRAPRVGRTTRPGSGRPPRDALPEPGHVPPRPLAGRRRGGRPGATCRDGCSR